MEEKGLGRRINAVRKCRGFTSERLSELCNINATYLRQIEGGTKMPSLPVFINICNAPKISPDYLLRENASPAQQEIASAMIRAVLEHGNN